MGKNKKNNRKFYESLALNDESFRVWENFFRRIALARFDWDNIPSTMNARFLEITLYSTGKASLLKDIERSFINTKCTNSGNINIYGLPTNLKCFSYGYNVNRILYTGKNEINGNDPYEEAILVMNDIECLPSINMMDLYCYRLAQCDRTCDVNVNAQKTPVMVLADDKTLLSVQNLANEYEGNEPFIVVNKNQLDEKSLRSINTNAPIVTKQIDEHKKEIINEALTYLGINNINIEKKERALTDEINSNNEVINLNMQNFLIPRLQACKEFNELFDLKVEEISKEEYEKNYLMDKHYFIENGKYYHDKRISVRVRSDLANIIKKELSSVKEYIPDEETINEKEGEINE